MNDPITSCVEDGIALLTIDVPGKPMNVVSPELRHSLKAAIAQVCNDDSIKGAILTSGKADFMAGGDLKAMLARFDEPLTAEEIYQHSSLFGDLIRHMESCGKPFVAAINGLALGGGFELALACHHRIVADLPKLLVGLPEVTLGLMPGGGGTQRLPRMIGAPAALPILLKGRPMTPREALEAGLVDAVVAKDKLLEAARDWINTVGDPVQRWEKDDWVIPGGNTLGDKILGPLYNQHATGIARDTQRKKPAPIAILTAVARGLPLPIEAGIRVERRQFVKLMQSPVTRNIIRTQFVSKGAAEKLARRPDGIETRQYTKIGVLGAGLMGAGIAQVSALAGLDVVLLDSSQENSDRGLAAIKATFDKSVKRGWLTVEKAQAALTRITPSSDSTQLAGAQLVVEAVFEDRDVKSQVFKAAYEVLGDGVVYATNTSTIPVSSLAAAVGKPDEFIGMHFFSPVDRMALVEIIKGRETSQKTLAHALDFARRIRKVPIVVNDSRSFFTSRVFSTYIAESLGMLAEGINPALIENGAKQAGFPIGPLTLIDNVTIELGLAAANQTRRDMGDDWKPSPSYPVQKLFVEELDRKGRRYGKGFYDYFEDGSKRLWPGFAEVYPPKEAQPSIEEVQQRMLYIQALEAVRCYEQGVLETISEGDVGSTLGIGYPAYTGGVFSLIDTVGIRAFVASCDQFADTLGERWRPTDGLRVRATKGELFYS